MYLNVSLCISICISISQCCSPDAVLCFCLHIPWHGTFKYAIKSFGVNNAIFTQKRCSWSTLIVCKIRGAFHTFIRYPRAFAFIGLLTHLVGTCPSNHPFLTLYFNVLRFHVFTIDYQTSTCTPIVVPVFENCFHFLNIINVGG